MTKLSAIPFSPLMVRAILSGQKTQTRRVVNPYPPAERSIIPYLPSVIVDQQDGTFAAYTDGRKFKDFRCPYGQPGDRLWVREAWRTEERFDHLPPSELPRSARIWYGADGGDPPAWSGRYRHARFMPLWCSRLRLLVTEVRCERLSSISEADALAEGVSWCDRMEGFHIEAGSYFHAASAVESFRGLWESINGPGSWSADPWAWAVSFRLR